KEYEILALYGVNGLTSEHLRALQNIENLDEVVLFFDGDDAGREAVKKQGKYLLEVLETKISVVDCPDGEDVNSLLEGHEEGIFTTLLENRTPFSFSPLPVEGISEAVNQDEKVATLPELNTRNPHKIKYETSVADYFIQGWIRKELDSLKVTLVIAHKESRVKSRNKLDLYEDKQSEKVAREAAEKLNLRADLIEYDLSRLVDLLDEYRESGKTETPVKKEISKIEEEKCLAFLKTPNLIKEINKKIGESGVVGEENNRVFLFTIASSHKMRDTMHALIQGSSGSGKTHLLASIMSLIPKEDRISLTRVTESSFYNYGEYFLRHKLIGIEDYEGLEEKAELAFRELQSKGSISSSTSVKDEYTGGNSSTIKWVYGPIASMSATTQGAIYEDNMSRCFLIAVDESEEQTQRIIKYQNQKAIGKIEEDTEKEAKLFIQNCVKLLKPYKVINPYADKIELPREAHKIRRLNELFQSFIRQLTLINQYQRKRDSQGRLITAKEDIEVAIEIMFDSIVLKVDE
ncbi:MAG: hypothetical protein GY810_08240, partial [Aureispira sp.]|nr:hypothetical protein [Aureispira sp.]